MDLDLKAILSLSSSFDILLTDLFVKNLPTPILGEDKKIVQILIYTLLCGASRLKTEGCSHDSYLKLGLSGNKQKE